MDNTTETTTKADPTGQTTSSHNRPTSPSKNTHTDSGNVTTTRKPKKLDPYARLGLRRQLYLESRAMAEFALAKGKSVSADVITAIESFKSEFPEFEDETSTTSAQLAAPQEPLPIDSLVRAHDVLAQVVEPATPKTILLLDMEQEASSIWKFLGPVSMVRQMMAVAIVSLVLFILLALSPHVAVTGLPEETGADGVLSGSGIPLLFQLLFFIASASMGTCFAALYKANSYITKGTFDPAHQAAYWIRFLLGVISGLMLAVILSEDALKGIEILEPGILRPLLAIVGGFSADLVYTFLNRIVETLRSLFQGSTDALVEQKSQEAQTKAAGQVAQTQMKVVSDLVNFQQELGTEATPEEVREKLNGLMQQFMPGSGSGSADAASGKK